ncbi:MAG TPA: SRPBCC domain-containing protein [Candidatus Limnocylindrales bacterium]|nr:SRPBCC domain-containing protein [Candidatus Limnocylindrales bacterium]
MTDQPAYDVEVSRLVDGPRDRVFHAFVDAVEFSQWYGPPGFPVPFDTVEIEPRTGGRHRFAMVGAADPSMRTTFDGRFTELIPDQILASSGTWSGIPGPDAGWVSNLRVELHDEDGKTRLLLREGPHPTGTIDLGRQAWELMLPRLEALVSGG